ncbi:linoleate 13S-lipoxygenase 2-1 [Forsythia ovata]|uniref:Linoleate 13S-lipoxygenase 2-1 n=1 Tax=Forsythia ovata TaxID=205694 RepID=A0ABD1RHU1_9LAMI
MKICCAKTWPCTGGNACFAVTPKFESVRKLENVRVGRASRTIKEVQTSTEKSTTITTTTSVAVEITVLKTLGGVLHQVGLVKEVLHVELVAAVLDPCKYTYTIDYQTTIFKYN